jgi:hypothetical protein
LKDNIQNLNKKLKTKQVIEENSQIQLFNQNVQLNQEKDKAQSKNRNLHSKIMSTRFFIEKQS